MKKVFENSWVMLVMLLGVDAQSLMAWEKYVITLGKGIGSLVTTVAVSSYWLLGFCLFRFHCCILADPFTSSPLGGHIHQSTTSCPPCRNLSLKTIGRINKA